MVGEIHRIPAARICLNEQGEGFFWCDPESVGTSREEMAAAHLGPQRRAEIEAALCDAATKLREMPTHCAEKYDGTPLVN